MICIRNLIIFTLLFSVCPIEGFAWTVEMEFEEGVVDKKVIGFSDAAGGSMVSAEYAYSGSKSAKLHVEKNSDGWGVWGGRRYFPSVLGEGDEVWIQISTFMPKDFNYSTNFALKFLRTLVRSDSGDPLGHIDIYINNDGSYRYQNELYTTERLLIQDRKGTFVIGETVVGAESGAKAIVNAIKDSGLVFEYLAASSVFTRWEKISGAQSKAVATLNRVDSNSVTIFGAENPIEKGVWETYIYNVRYSASSPRVRFYKYVGGELDNSKKRIGSKLLLMFEDTTDFTLQNPTDIADTFLLFTYWNGSSPASQSMYVDDLYISTDPPLGFVQGLGHCPDSLCCVPASP